MHPLTANDESIARLEHALAQPTRAEWLAELGVEPWAGGETPEAGADFFEGAPQRQPRPREHKSTVFAQITRRRGGLGEGVSLP